MFALTLVTYLDRVCIGATQTVMSAELGLDQNPDGRGLQRLRPRLRTIRDPRRLARRSVWRAGIAHTDRDLVVGVHGGDGPRLEPHQPAHHSVPVRLWRGGCISRHSLGHLTLVSLLRAWACAGRHHGRKEPWRRISTPNGHRADGRHVGWRGVYWVFAGLGIVWAFFWTSWYRNSPEEHPSVSAEELAFIQKGRASASHSHSVPWALLVRSRNVWALCAMYSGYAFGLYFYLTWLPTYLEEARGIPLSQVGYYAMLPLLVGAGLQPAGRRTHGLPVATCPASLGPPDSHHGRPAGRIRSALDRRSRRGQHHRDCRASTEFWSGGL